MCQYDVIPILVHLLKDKVEEVQASAAGALMYATVTTEGEAACRLGVQGGGCPVRALELTGVCGVTAASRHVGYPGQLFKTPHRAPSCPAKMLPTWC